MNLKKDENRKFKERWTAALDCLFQVVELSCEKAVELDVVLAEAVNLIPRACGNPEHTGARIILESREFKTNNYRPTSFNHLAPIEVNGIEVGRVEAVYLQELTAEEEAFSQEEKKLLQLMASQLSFLLRQKQTEEDLHHSEARFQQLAENTQELISPHKKAEDALRRSLHYSRSGIEILNYMAEGNELPWVIQVVLLKVLEITEFDAGAIHLIGGDSYSFMVQEGMPEPVIPQNLHSANSDGLFVQDGKEDPIMQCALDKWARETGFSKILKSEYGSFIFNQLSSLLEDVRFTQRAEGCCTRCIQAGYETVALLPLKAGQQLTGILYLLNRNPHALDKEAFYLLESIIYPLGYAVQNMQAQEQLKESFARNKSLSAKILKAFEEERARMARELHDEIGQVLTAIKLELQIMERDYGKKEVNLSDKLPQSIALVDSLMDFTRTKAVSLRPPALDDMGLVPAVRNMANGFSKRTGIQTKVSAKGCGTYRLSEELETALFRCIQEALTNVYRHARANKVLIAVEQNPGELVARIEDNGVGFNPESLNENRDCVGLVGMQERVDLIDGKLTIDSKPGRGSRILIKVEL